VPGLLLAFTVRPQTADRTVLAYLVVSQFEANLVYPLIQKEAVAASPALNLMAVLAFGTLFRLLGILLATPLLVVISVFVVMLYVRGALRKEAVPPGQ
jgi:predicted PurR-regulated permease PerM